MSVGRERQRATGLRPLILSGGPAAGKTTCGRRLAEELPRAAFVDADDIRQLVVSGEEALWRGDEGEAQLRLGSLNAAAIARNFGAAGFATVIADIVTPASLPVYREHLPDAFVVHLRISLAEAWRRARTRRVYLTDDEFEALHALLADPPPVDLVLDVDGLRFSDQLGALRDAWRPSGDFDGV